MQSISWNASLSRLMPAAACLKPRPPLSCKTRDCKIKSLKLRLQPFAGTHHNEMRLSMTHLLSFKHLLQVCCNYVASKRHFGAFQQFPQTKNPCNCKGFEVLRIDPDYLFENWLALLAFLSPYFFLSFILESLVRKPAALRAGLYASLSASQRALEIPCLKAPA